MSKIWIFEPDTEPKFGPDPGSTEPVSWYSTTLPFRGFFSFICEQLIEKLSDLNNHWATLKQIKRIQWPQRETLYLLEIDMHGRPKELSFVNKMQ